MEDTSNKLWRFGDSWSLTMDGKYGDIEKNHAEYIAEYFNLNFVNLGRGGIGNLEICSNVLKNTHKFIKGDVVLINFGNMSRISLIESGKVICSVRHEDSETPSKLMQDVMINDLAQPISDIIFYIMKDYIESLIEGGIRVYHSYNSLEKQEINYGIKNELVFDIKNKSFGNYGLCAWCRENGYEDLSPNGNLHYKVGSQKSIANKIIELIEEHDNQEKRVGIQ